MGKVFFLVRGKFFLVSKNIFLVDENVFLVVGAFDPYSFTDCYSSETCYIQLVTFCDNLIAFWYRHDLLRLTQELLQFPFFPSRHFFWMDCQKLFSKRFMISYQESVWPRSDSFLGHTEKYFLKNCSLSCPSWRVWHMTQLMHGNQHS